MRTHYFTFIFLAIGFIFCLQTPQIFASQKGSQKYHVRGSGDHQIPHMDFGGPREGEKAPDFRLQTITGKSIKLSEYVSEKPVLLEFGSYTCPVFRKNHAKIEKLYKRYKGQVNFLVIYTIEAHPKEDPSPYTGKEWVTEPNREDGVMHRQPDRFKKRRELARRARSALKVQMPLLIDKMDNSVWKAYGKAPNSAYLIDTDGKVILRQAWADPDKLKAVLEGRFNPRQNWAR